MASAIITTFFLLLGMQSLVMVLSAESPITLVTVKRTESADNQSYTFSATFKAPKKPTAVWTNTLDNFLYDEERIPGAALNYNAETKTGQTSATVTKTSLGDMAYITLRLGDMNSQLFFMLWGVRNITGDAEDTFNLPVMEVTPSTDLSYTDAGSIVNVTLSKRKTFRGQPIKRDDRYTAEFHVKSSNKIEMKNIKNFDAIQVEEREEGERKIAVLKFNTTDPLNGYVMQRVLVWHEPKCYNKCPVDTVREYVLIKVHEEKYSGPFPDGELYVEMYTPSCWYDPMFDCDLSCSVTGNNIEKVEIFKENEDGSRTLLSSGKPFDANMYHYQDVYFEPTPTNTKFICKATADGGKVSKEFKISKPQ